MTEKILLKRHNNIVILTFNRPQALNALDLVTMRRFAKIISDLQTDDDLSALILTGSGEDAFCSGGDLYELSQLPTEDDGLSFITIMGDALLALERLPVPVIAAVNGYALGGGSEIATACDLRIVDENTGMGFVQVKMGLTPGWGTGQRLLRLVGYPKAMQLLLSGRVIHAQELIELGLANQIVAPGGALDEAMNFVEKYIAPNPPDVVRGIKTLLRAGLEQSYDDALQIERKLFPPLWAAEPHLTAVDNFLKRRQSNKDDK